MMLHVITAAAMFFSVIAAATTAPTLLTYGKYYGRGGADNINSYYLFLPPGDRDMDAPPLPVIVEFHGGGFTGGAATTEANALIDAALANNIAFISVNYRLVTTKYYYKDDDGKEQPEELINVDSAGRLTLSSTTNMSAYKVRRGRQEFNTKCSFDAVQMIEHLAANAEKMGLDPHRISFTGSSAGGGEINYLTWVYSPENRSYTPVGMVYTMAQLDYPVQNMLDRAWGLWADDLGNETKLDIMLSFSDCGMILGNPWCNGQRSDYNVCNKTYQQMTHDRFCASEALFGAATLGEVRNALVWPRDDPVVGRGMERLWYTSENMLLRPLGENSPFHLFVVNRLNSTAGMNVVHSALYARQYARIAEAAGVNFSVYYTDYEGMRDSDKGTERVSAGGGRVIFNYRTNFGWAPPANVERGSDEEGLLFHCRAFGLANCTVSGGGGGLTPACKAATKRLCGEGSSASYCASCVRANAWSLIAAGCPKASQGGERKVQQFCESSSR